MPTRPRAHRPRTAPQKKADPFYKSAQWLALRKIVLQRDPLCVECKAAGKLTPASHVDHKISRRDRPDLACDLDNLRALCPSCHNSKTAAVDGGLGRPRRSDGA